MSKKKIGVTVGRFDPLHKGHEAMIEFGSMMLDHLLVIVSDRINSEDDGRHLAQRFEDVKSFVYKEGLRNVSIILREDQSPIPKNVDEHGTVLDKDFQEYWKNVILETPFSTNITHFLSSDQYGKVMADRLSVEWLPFDPDREMFRVSGTLIRETPLIFFDMISDIAKPRYKKRIAIVGPESSGKSTLAKNLALAYGAKPAIEYGRVLSVAKNNHLTEGDFDDILRGQNALMKLIETDNNSSIVITDTEAYTTYLFGKKFFNKNLTHIYRHASLQKFDLYIVLPPSFDWVDDGSRIMPDQNERETFYRSIVTFLNIWQKPYKVIDRKDHDKRFFEAKDAIDDLLINRNT